MIYLFRKKEIKNIMETEPKRIGIEKPSSTTNNPEDAKKMLKPGEEVEQTILNLRIRGAKGKRFKQFAQQLKQNAAIAGLDIIHAELEKAGKRPETFDVTVIDPEKLSTKTTGKTVGVKVMKKKEKEHSKLSPDELSKMGYNPDEWERMTKAERGSNKSNDDEKESN